MEGRRIRMSFKAAWEYKLEFSVGSLQRCIELQMNSKLNSRKAKDFMVFKTVKKGNTLADNHSKIHLEKKYNRDASRLVKVTLLSREL